MCTWVGFRPIYWMCLSNNVVSTILRWFDLAMTLRWPYHDLGITPLWNPTLTHVTMCTWPGFRPIYFYTTPRVKGILLRWPLVTLSMHRKSADHLKVTWFIIRFKKNMFYKSSLPRGGAVQSGPRSNSLTLQKWRPSWILLTNAMTKIISGHTIIVKAHMSLITKLIFHLILTLNIMKIKKKKIAFFL